MKIARNLVALVVVTYFVCAQSHFAWAQDKATPQELVSKVREAASVLSKSGEPGLADFDKKPGSWVWKDTYIFVLDCTKGTMAAHPLKAELIGKPLTALKDMKGNPAFELLCTATASPNGAWAEYWIPKLGEKEGSRKISYGFLAAGTPYVVGAGIFDAETAIADLAKNTPK
jgi:cytochrome c